MSNLLNAIKDGDLIAIAQYANAKNINSAPFFEPEKTPLVCAIMYDQIESAKLLLKLGANPNVSFVRSTTPLTIACLINNQEMAKLLLENGAQANFKIENSQNPLVYAIHYNNYELADLLLNHGADLNKGTTSPLYNAALNDNLTGAKYLVEHGADVNFNLHHTFETTALAVAAEVGNTEMVKYLLDSGANPNTYTPNEYGPHLYSSALFNAIEYGYKEITQLLLDAGAGVSEGLTPVEIAILKGDISTVKGLLENAPDINVVDGIGHTPFHYAIFSNNLEMLNLLKQLYPNIIQQVPNEYEGLALTEMAILSDASEACIWLIENGVDVNQKYEYGDTALHFAASVGHSEIVLALLDHGADIHARDEYGNSLMHSAVHSKDPTMLSMLVEHGAELNIQNNRGQTELFEAAVRLRHDDNVDEILKLLLELGSDPNIKDNDGYTALEYFKAVNKNTFYLVDNYDSICEILSNPKSLIAEHDVLEHKAMNFDNGMPVPPVTEITTHEQTRCSYQSQHFDLFEQHIVSDIS